MNTSKLSHLIDSGAISKAEILRRTGWTRPTLDAILNGKDFRVSNLEKLANVLNLKVGYFFDEEVTEIRQAGRDYVEDGKIEHKGTEYNAPVTITDEALREENERLKEELLEARKEIITLMKEKR